MAWVYILRCRDGSYYTGSTVDLDRRLWEHNESPDLGAAYTRRRRPVELAWCADLGRVDAAFFVEKQVQGWTRAKKEALMRGDYDALIALARRKGVQDRELAAAFEAEARRQGA
jgi:putative endonuclease